MKPITSILTATVLFFAAGELQGQQAPASDHEAQLRAMVIEPVAAERDRAVVRDFLHRADVADLVAERGLDMERLKAGVSTLDADVASDLARHVQSMGEAAELVGGNTIVISTTTVIIILLLIILLT
jgi:hypothetical protein